MRHGRCKGLAKILLLAAAHLLVLWSMALGARIQNSQEPHVLLKAALEHAEKGQPSDAIRLLRVLVSTYPDHDLATEAQLELGRYLKGLGHLDAAIEELQEVVDSHPQSPSAAEAHFLLASCYRRQKKCIESIREYEKFLKHPLGNPELAPEAHWWIASSSELLGDVHRAVSEWQLMCENYPGTRFAKAAEKQLAYVRSHPEVVTLMRRANRFPFSILLRLSEFELRLRVRSYALLSLFRGAKWLSLNLAAMILCLGIASFLTAPSRSAAANQRYPSLDYRPGIRIYVLAIIASAAGIWLSGTFSNIGFGRRSIGLVSTVDDLVWRVLVVGSFLSIPILYLRSKNIELSRIGLKRPDSNWAALVKWLFLAVVVFIGISVLYTVLSMQWQGVRTASKAATSSGFSQVLGSGSPLLLGLFLGLYAILVPVAEEVLYRGVVYSFFRTRSGPVAAAILSAVVFSVVHRDVWLMLRALLIGLVLALLYQKTRSLYPSMAVHSLFNMLASLSLWLQSGSQY